MFWRHEEYAISVLEGTGVRPTSYRDSWPKTLRLLHNAAQECSPWVRPFLFGLPKQRKERPGLIYIYPFDPAKQSEYLDGQCSTFDDRRFATVGISTTVIHGDPDYLRLTLLHEIGHLVYFDHSPDFVQLLDRMVFEFNELHDKNLKNDLSHEGLYLDATGHFTVRADGSTVHIS